MNVLDAALVCVIGLCAPGGQTVFLLQSSGPAKTYGVLVEAPPSDCAFARYELADAGGRLGTTPPLKPGMRAVVRVGNGFDQGLHLLTVRATGCQAGIPDLRRVVLQKPGPDHGWRAGLLLR